MLYSFDKLYISLIYYICLLCQLVAPTRVQLQGKMFKADPVLLELLAESYLIIKVITGN